MGRGPKLSCSPISPYDMLIKWKKGLNYMFSICDLSPHVARKDRTSCDAKHNMSIN